MHVRPSSSPLGGGFFCLLVRSILLAITLAPFLFTNVGHAASVTLEWDRNPEEDIAGYRLYSGQTSRSYVEKIEVGTSTRFTLVNLSDGTGYYFAVTAFNQEGMESGYSNEVFYRPPPKPVIAPFLFMNVGHAASVTLEWDRNPERDIAGYRLYCGQTSRSYSKMIEVGTSTRFVVGNLPDDTGYYFAVTAFNREGMESDYSNEIFYRTPPKPVIRTGRNKRPRSRPLAFDTYQAVPFAGKLYATDPEGDPLRFMIIRQGRKGLARVIDPGTGSFLYTPLPGAMGRDVFRFRVDDGRALSNISAVRVRILPEKTPSLSVLSNASLASLNLCDSTGVLKSADSTSTGGMLPFHDLPEDSLEQGTVGLEDLDEETLKRIGDYELDFISGGHVESLTWRDLMENQNVDFVAIGGINVLLPISKQNWSLLSASGFRLSQDLEFLTVFLHEMGGTGELNSGRLAICARYPGGDGYLSVFFRDCPSSDAPPPP